MKEIEDRNKETAKFVKEFCVPVLKDIKSMMKDNLLSVEVWHYNAHGLTMYGIDETETIQYCTVGRDLLAFLIDGKTIFDYLNCKGEVWQFLEMLQSFKKGMAYAR